MDLFFLINEIGQHSHLSGSLHPAHAHMHGGWYASGMGALGASSGLQSGFSSGGLAGGVVPHSQSYHLMVSINKPYTITYPTIFENFVKKPKNANLLISNQFFFQTQGATWGRDYA